MVAVLKTALEMNADEVAERYRRNLEFSTKLTTNNWAIEVLHDLMSVEKNMTNRKLVMKILPLDSVWVFA